MKNITTGPRYLVVTYKDVPDTDFICDCKAEIRLRVSKIPKNKLFELSKTCLCAILDNCILVFEEIGNTLGTNEEILKAIFWYRNWLGEKTMYILNPVE